MPSVAKRPAANLEAPRKRAKASETRARASETQAKAPPNKKAKVAETPRKDTPRKRPKDAPSKKAKAAETPGKDTPHTRPKDTTQQRIDDVAEALGDHELMQTSTSLAVREMLAAGLRHALNVPVENRHSMQVTVTDHVREVFSDAAAGARERTNSAEAGVAAAAAASEAQAAQLAVAVEAAKASEKVVEDCRQALGEQEAALKAAEAQVRAANAKQKELERERNAQHKQKDKYLDIKDNYFQVLVDGTAASEKDAKKLCDRLIKEMEKLDTDKSLVDSLPLVLLKKATERGGFDDMVITTFRDSLNSRIAAVDGVLEANANSEKELQEECEKHKAAIEQSQAAAGQASEALSQAESERAGKEEARRAEEASVEASRAAVLERRSELKAMEDLAQKLQQVVDTFEALVARSAATAVTADEGDAVPEPEAAA